MKISKLGLVLLATGCAAHAPLDLTPPAAAAPAAGQKAAGKERVVYSFTGYTDGGNAATQLVLDSSGNAYGTTVIGGTYQCGTIFEATPQATPPWPEKTLYSFTCYGDGKYPHGGVTFDAQGNLDGTTTAGGTGYCSGDGCGVVFQYASARERVLHAFTGEADGFGPGSPVAIDAKGNVFGTAPDGGADGLGTIFEIMKWGKEKTLHAFTGGSDGSTGSLGAPLLDASGNIYGVTETGGTSGNGIVYEVSPRGAKSKFTTLYTFHGAPDAGSPYGGLIEDTIGNLYGTSYYGGAHGQGAVFELMPKGTMYAERVLYSFKGGNDGSQSTSTLAFGKNGMLYGTTSAGGGSCDCGAIFSLDPKTGKEKALHGFGGAGDGEYPYYGVTREAGGKFVGTTVAGGANGQGTLFEFTP